MANAQNLSQDMQNKLTAAGIDAQKLLNSPPPPNVDATDWKKWINIILQVLISIFGSNPPTPAKAANHAGELNSIANACPCPDGKDGFACCHAAQTHILLAALCCEGHCCKGQQCDTKCCCQEMMCHLLCALECCSSHCCE